MKRSTDRMLTTHVGSLPRPADLLQMVADRAGGKPVDESALKLSTQAAVKEIVRKQTEDVGLDVIDDGEQSKPSFSSYVIERLSGIEMKPAEGPVGGWLNTREGHSFPDFYGSRRGAPAQTQLVCTGPITYRGQAAVQADIENFKAAVAEATYTEGFLPSISPSNAASNRRNEYYRTEEEFLQAIGDAMHQEYQAIVNSGLLVQVDDPALATSYNNMPNASMEEVRSWAARRVELVNYALRGLPE